MGIILELFLFSRFCALNESGCGCKLLSFLKILVPSIVYDRVYSLFSLFFRCFLKKCVCVSLCSGGAGVGVVGEGLIAALVGQRQTSVSVCSVNRCLEFPSLLLLLLLQSEFRKHLKNAAQSTDNLSLSLCNAAMPPLHRAAAAPI